MMNRRLLLTSALTLCIAASFPAYAAEPPAVKSEFEKALMEGKPLFLSRYRYEYVDQDGLPEDAHAHTLVTRLGYETGAYKDFSALIEFEHLESLGTERFNDSINGKTRYPVVVDPEDTNLNRLMLTYAGIPDTKAILGRQTIVLDNQRFVGGIAWRQNDQTFDALSVSNTSLPDTTLYYAYANQVNRVQGTNSPVGVWDDSHIHLINASYTGLPYGRLVGYSYLLDIPDSAALSSATYGARFEGKQAIDKAFTGLLSLEYAHQVDYANNSNNTSFNYYMIEPGIAFGQWKILGQYEHIEGDGANAMQFAIGTNHAFDGWVDKFLTTPANGLIDMNIAVNYTVASEQKWLNGTRAMVRYHDFRAEKGDTHYGNEWNLFFEQTIESHYTIGMQAGHYEADNFSTDTTKIMPYVQVKF